MTYQEFINHIICLVEQKLPEGVVPYTRKITFNNSVEKDSLSFSCGDDSVSPIIYLDSYYSAYQRGDMTTDDVSDDIVKKYNCSKPKENLDTERFRNFSEVEDDIVYRLVNREKNEERLKSVPHIPYLDLEITFACLVSVNERHDGSIRIDDRLSSLWGTTADVLWQKASKNTSANLPEFFRPMKELLIEFLPTYSPELEPCYPKAEELTIPMYVLTNSQRIHGASVILYDRLLNSISVKLSDSFYILPSSIHEVIIVPAQSAPSVDTLNEIIQSCNSSCLSPDDYLSDHAYFFDKNTREVTY